MSHIQTFKASMSQTKPYPTLLCQILLCLTIRKLVNMPNNIKLQLVNCFHYMNLLFAHWSKKINKIIKNNNNNGKFTAYMENNPSSCFLLFYNVLKVSEKKHVRFTNQ